MLVESFVNDAIADFEAHNLVMCETCCVAAELVIVAGRPKLGE